MFNLYQTALFWRLLSLRGGFIAILFHTFQWNGSTLLILLPLLLGLQVYHTQPRFNFYSSYSCEVSLSRWAVASLIRLGDH